MRVAVTVDDLPANGGLIPGMNRMSIALDVLRALTKNGVVQAYGFANGRDIGSEPDLIDVLKEWLKANYPIGNHTYNHTDLNNVTAQAYIADIEKMDIMLQMLSPVSQLIEERRVYRYPYLEEGDSLEKRDAVRAYVFKNGYRIAEVIVDYYDWAWNAAYTQCVAQHNQKSIAWPKGHVVDGAERNLGASIAISELLFGRDIPQILLVHIGAFDAIMLDRILGDFRAHGVKFVTLDEALGDSAYKMNSNFTFKIGLTFLEQVAAAAVST